MNSNLEKFLTLFRTKFKFWTSLVGVVFLVSFGLYGAQLFLFNTTQKNKKHQVVVALSSPPSTSKVSSIEPQQKKENLVKKPLLSDDSFTTPNSSKSLKSQHVLNDADTDFQNQTKDNSVLHKPILSNNFPKEGAFFKYQQTFDNPQKLPFITLLLTHVGLNGDQTENLIKELPSGISLAFVPFVTDLTRQIQENHQRGHEILLMIPLEPIYYPENDPGENLLLTGLSADKNNQRLQFHLKESEGIIGVVGSMGSRFLASPLDMTPFLKELQRKGLMMVEAPLCKRSVTETLAFGVCLPFLSFDTQIDETLDREEIEARLKILEEEALKTGSARGYGKAYPITIQTLVKWTETLFQKGILLAPLSANSFLKKDGIIP